MRTRTTAAALLLGALASFSAVTPAAEAQPTKVACVGDSITHGSGSKDPKTESYPAQLQKLLGDKYKVENFGVSGATLLNDGDRPYQKQKLFTAALEFKPDVVVIMLGTNDSKPQNWKYKEKFEADYKNLVDQFESLATHPKVFLCLPPPVPGKGNYRINEEGVTEELPIIESVARAEHARVIDIHKAFEGHEALLPDRVHPDAEGYALLAKTVEHSIAEPAKGS